MTIVFISSISSEALRADRVDNPGISAAVWQKLQDNVNKAKRSLIMAKKRGNNFSTAQKRVDDAVQSRDQAIAQFIEADGQKTRQAIQESEENVKAHVTGELKEMKEKVDAIAKAVGVDPESATTPQLVAQRHLLAHHLKNRRMQDQEEKEAAKWLDAMAKEEKTQKLFALTPGGSSGSKDPILPALHPAPVPQAVPRASPKAKAAPKSHSGNFMHTTQANINKFFGKSAADKANAKSSPKPDWQAMLSKAKAAAKALNRKRKASVLQKVKESEFRALESLHDRAAFLEQAYIDHFQSDGQSIPEFTFFDAWASWGKVSDLDADLRAQLHAKKEGVKFYDPKLLEEYPLPWGDDPELYMESEAVMHEEWDERERVELGQNPTFSLEEVDR